MEGIKILTNEEKEILLKEYDFGDYSSITSFFKLMKSDYLEYIKVWNNASKEDKPENENRLYDLLRNEEFSKFLVEKINDKSISNRFLPDNATNSNLPYLLYFCVYYKEFNCPSEDFYIAYLFNKDLSKVFLTLVLGSTNKADINLDFYSEKNSLKENKLRFKEYIENNYQSEILSMLKLNIENYNDDIYLGRFDSKDEVSSPSSQNNYAKNYEDGSIYVKAYEIEDLPSENELIADFNNFIILYNFILKKIFKDYDVSEDKISFQETLGLVKKILKDNGTIIGDNYDMLLVKKLISEDFNQNNNSKGKTTNITLTNEKMDIFPFLESFDYFYNENGENDDNLKRGFLLEVPVYLYSSNLDYLRNDRNLTVNEKILTNATVTRYRKDDKNWNWELFKKQIDDLKDNSYERRMKLLGYEVHAELSSDYSGMDFVKFCELLIENYFLIILKYEKEFKYDIFAVLPKDGEELLSLNFELFSQKNNSVTIVSPSLWSTENESNDKSSHPLWSKNYNIDDIKDGGKNVLYYGVPGSGKSSAIESEYFNDESNIERVVFHPDYTYSDFIGQILPKTFNGNVSYEFIEGPFTSILMKACANPNKEFYLIIEEINRGNAPAIFGDVFQLLDRRTMSSDEFPIGTSEYAISNFDMADKVYGDENHKIRIPSNLSIIASMNTADQNVFTLDTAFQRRWDMRLIPNKFDENHDFAEKTILDSTVTWKKFVTGINDLILEKNTLITSSEDKRLGVYFIKEDDLNDENKFAEKVLKYLWDDAFKFSRDKIFIDECNSLEDVIEIFKNSNGDKRFSIFINNIFLTHEISNGETIE